MAPSQVSPEPARRLFDEGMASLVQLVPLFDTGFGTFYDLRHFSAGLAPNRWVAGGRW